MQQILQRTIKSLTAVFALLITAWLTNPVHAQPGTLDPSFNPSDAGFGSGDEGNGIILRSVVQPDGKIILGGGFTIYGGQIRSGVVRLNADGSVDQTFNPGTGINGVVYSVALQPDNKIILVGGFTSYNGTPRNRVVRINADGSIDNTFNPGTGANDTLWAVGLQSDGKIILGGELTSFNGTACQRLIRLNTNGSLDATFNSGGTGPNADVLTLSVASDNKIIAGGLFVQYNGTARSGFTRTNADGTVDNTFAIGAGANNGVLGSAIQSDGKVLIGGAFTSIGGTPNINRIVRLNIDGSRDATFNTGAGFNSQVWVITVQADGKVLVGGDYNTFNGSPQNFIARLNTNGSLDNTFNVGSGANSSVYAISVKSNDKVQIGGAFTQYNGFSSVVFAQLNSNGSFDTDFNRGSGANRDIFASLVQTDGKIYLGGRFGKYNGEHKFGLIRVNSNGSLDNTFNTGTGPNNSVLAMTQQPDGKLIIGGLFTSYNGSTINRLARINANGSLDGSFSVGTGASGSISAVILQSDGKVVAGGNFTQFNGNPRAGIVRVNADGSLDGTFNPGSGINTGGVFAIARQSDGKFIIGGDFTTFNGTPRARIARINADGSLDATFNPGSGFADFSVQTISIQSDGKIIVGGTFTSYNGTPVGRLVRLNADGSRDGSFNITSAPSDLGVFASLIRPDGKMLVGGIFSTMNGSPAVNIAMLQPNGELEPAFLSGTGAGGPNATVRTVSLQPDGLFIIGGNFTNYNGVGRNRAARIINPVNTGSPLFNKVETFQAAVFPNPNSGNFNLSVMPPVAGEYMINVYDLGGRVILSEAKNFDTGMQIMPLRINTPGMYVVSVGNNQYQATSRVVVN